MCVVFNRDMWGVEKSVHHPTIPKLLYLGGPLLLTISPRSSIVDERKSKSDNVGCSFYFTFDVGAEIIQARKWSTVKLGRIIPQFETKASAVHARVVPRRRVNQFRALAAIRESEAIHG